MILIVSHFSKNRGTTDYFVGFLEKQKIKHFYLCHPFQFTDIKDSQLIFFDGQQRHVIHRYKRFKRAQLDLIRNFVVSLFVSFRLRNTIKTVVGMGSFNCIPFIFSKKRLVFWGVDYSTKRFESGFLNKLYNLFETLACQYSDKVFHPNLRQEQARIDKHKLTKDKSIIVPNGISDLNSFDDKQSAEVVSLIYIGSIADTHGVVEFIKRYYIERDLPYKLYVFGGGENEAELRALIVQNQLEGRVKYFGYQSKAEICKFINDTEEKFFGIAPYQQQEEGHLYYADSLKIKEYLNYNMPFISIDLMAIPDDLKQFGFIYSDIAELDDFFANRIHNFVIDNIAKDEALSKYQWSVVIDRAMPHILPAEQEMVSIVLAQSFLPGGAGKEVAIHNFSQKIYEQITKNVEIISFVRFNQNNISEFDENYNLPISRIRNRFFSSGLDKRILARFNSVVGGKRRLDVLGRLSMLITATVSITLLFITTIKRIKIHKKKKIILHCHGLASVFVAVACRALFFRRSKIAIMFTNGFVYKKSGFFLVDYVIKNILKRTDSILCISEYSTKVLIDEFDLDPDKVIRYRYWIDLDFAENFDKELTLPIKILFVGRIVPEKGIAEIIELAKYIDQQNLSHRYQITVIGDSKHEIMEDLMKASHELSCLKALGRINKPELWQYYSQHDIFLMPSTWAEGCGNVILEAYAFGLPVIGSNMGGIPESISQFDYYKIVDNLDAQTLLRAVDVVYQSIQNDGHQCVLERSQQVLKEKYSPNNFDTHKQAYLKLIEKLK